LRAAAVVPAGGSGSRMGGAVPKQYLDLDGEPILLRAIRPLLAHPDVGLVVLALPTADAEAPPFDLPDGVRVVAGGADRGDSVRRALDAVPADAEIVLIHDGARPLLTGAVVDRVLAAVTDDAGAIAALPVTDTLKRADGEGRITGTVDRQGLWRAQTPQAFPRGLIVDAYRRAEEDGVSATDDAALVERFGGRVVVVPGDPANVKVTRPADLELARVLLPAASS
jgi:2-C-methyl-D-erythritol 4-phosphate cytidylyltransferase